MRVWRGPGFHSVQIQKIACELVNGCDDMAKPFAKMINGKICMTTAALTEILGITQQALSLWKSQGCPQEMRGWWSIRDVLMWKGLLTTSGVKTEDEAAKMSWAQKKLEAEARLKEQKAEEAEFKNAISRGEYIQKDDVTAELQRFFVVLKRSMLGYSRRIATELAAFVDVVTARRIEKMITELTLDALEQISIDGVYKPPRKKAKA